MVNLLIASLTSFRSILETVHQLSPESAFGTVQRNLISQTLHLVQMKGPEIPAFADIEAKPQKRTKRFDSDLLVDTGQDSPLSNIEVSPDRTYGAVATGRHNDHSNSNTPLFHHYNRMTQQTQQSTPQPLTSQFTPINQPTPTTSPAKTSTTLYRTTSSTQKKRPSLLASLAISTALPPNYHPRCVGKGLFAKATYNLNDEVGYMLRDVEMFCEDGDGDGDGDEESEDGDEGGKEFRCGDCDKVYFG
jgi:hypothetical protein